MDWIKNRSKICFVIVIVNLANALPTMLISQKSFFVKKVSKVGIDVWFHLRLIFDVLKRLEVGQAELKLLIEPGKMCIRAWSSPTII